MENQYNYYQPESPSHIQSDADKKKPPKKNKTPLKFLLVISLALVFGIVASLTFTFTNMLSGHVRNITAGLNPFAVEGPEVVEEPEEIPEVLPFTEASENDGPILLQSASVVSSDVSDMVERVMPSVVAVTNLSAQQVQDWFGNIHTQENESAGSGFIIAMEEDELLIVTNDHVISGSDTISITFYDGTILDADVKGSSPDYDLAIVAVSMDHISAETLEVIAVATIGDSNQLRMGEPAIAIGNSLGYGQTVTTGVISALNRVSQAPSFDLSGGMSADMELIQTDAAINPGNSGGPLMNAVGEVIGINSAKLVGATIEGVGYAIPISDVADILDNLMAQTTRPRVDDENRGFLGISGTSISPDSSERYDMPQGVFISEVHPGSGADEAGLSRGSIITAIDGRSVTSMEALQRELQFFAVGERVPLTVQVPQSDGGYEETIVNIILGERSE
ncbi:MAG: trypsin-like peptidase domain-containing protein [Lachnospiraceae bacterium]|nr:trypsin-like peptidase domain-containing protein [Lachnospiraceae bacterium]